MITWRAEGLVEMKCTVEMYCWKRFEFIIEKNKCYKMIFVVENQADLDILQKTK